MSRLSPASSSTRSVSRTPQTICRPGPSFKDKVSGEFFAVFRPFRAMGAGAHGRRSVVLALQRPTRPVPRPAAWSSPGQLSPSIAYVPEHPRRPVFACGM